MTGHQAIHAAVRDLVTEGARRAIRGVVPPLRLVTSLAAGADQLVAEEVAAARGRLAVVVPCRTYVQAFSDAASARRYRSLLARACDIERLDYDEPTEEAFWAAARRIVERCEVLLAIGDGAPARGLGGTADVVGGARRCDVDVRIIWPAGASR